MHRTAFLEATIQHLRRIPKGNEQFLKLLEAEDACQRTPIRSAVSNGSMDLFDTLLTELERLTEAGTLSDQVSLGEYEEPPAVAASNSGAPSDSTSSATKHLLGTDSWGKSIMTYAGR